MNTLRIQLFLFFLLCMSLCRSQTYKFDKIVKHTTHSYPNQERINLFNSDDSSYHMQIYNRNDSLVSRIYDTQKKQAHYFYIDKSDSLKLYFLKTKNIIKRINDHKFEFSEIKEKKGRKEIIFKILNSKNKKMPAIS